MSDETQDADAIAREDTATANTDVITMAHGAGGTQMRELIQLLVGGRFEGSVEGGIGLEALDDGAVIPIEDADSLVVTTDSHVVTPLTYPGGDIGRLAVSGTVNDLAVMGGTRPVALTSSLVIEEGTEVGLVESVNESMRLACEEAGCAIMTGDTKVMGRGEVDTLIVNTTGVAAIPAGQEVSDAGLSPGDVIIVTGTVGDHGITLLAEREGFEFDGDLESDVAPINDLIEQAMAAGDVTAMKDPTRGGLAGVLNEMAGKASVGIEILESDVPIAGSVASAGSILGIEPMNVANEGIVVMAVAPEDADSVLETIRSHPRGESAAIIGDVTDENRGSVVLDTGIGRRFMREPEGAQLPRIC
jgi:hydrogenase expression/formation protein HypE